MVRNSTDGIRVVYSIEKSTLPVDLNNFDTAKISLGDHNMEVWQPIKTSSILGWLHMRFDTSGLTTIRESIWHNKLLTSLYAIVIYLVALLFVLRLRMRGLKQASRFALHLDNLKGEELNVTPSSHKVNTLTKMLNQASKTLHDQHQAIQRAKSEAEQANKAKSLFLANMSHEIRTPMNGVLGMATLLEKSALNDAQKKYINTLVHSGKNLLSIINDILDFSKVEAGKIEPEQSKFNLHLCVDYVVSSFYQVAAKNNIKLNYVIEPNVSESMIGDSTRLSQILNNLISNAIKFSTDGSIDVRVKSIVENEQAMLMFTIKDTGIGIKEGALPTLLMHLHKQTYQQPVNMAAQGWGSRFQKSSSN